MFHVCVCVSAHACWKEDAQTLCFTCRHLHNMQGSSKFMFKINKLQTILKQRHVKLGLLIPNMYVEGSYECDRMAYGNYDSKSSGNFR
jgi:hypothetical protein